LSAAAEDISSFLKIMGLFYHAKAQRRKEILIPSEAVDGKIYFFSREGAVPAFRRLCGLSAAAED
jgi:hypothetical protein